MGEIREGQEAKRSMISNRLSTRLSLTTTTDNNSGNGGGNLNNPGRGNGSNTRSSLGSSPLAVGRHISRLGHNFELEEEQVAGSGQQHYDGMSSSLLSLVWSNSSSSALSKKDNREQQSPLGLSDATTPTSTPNRNHGRSHAQHHHQSSSPNPWCLLFLLNVVAIIWGTQHPIIKIVVDSGSDFDDGVITKAMSNKEVSSATDNVSPALAVLLRFAVAAILSSPSIISMIFRPRKRIAKIWRWGFELGIYMTTGFALQAMALTITTAQRSGFLLYLNVKFVPLFGWILGGKRISIISWTSAFVALVGTALLTLGGQDTTPFNLGDILAIGSAITSALFIWRLEIASSQLQVTLSSALDEEGGNDRGTRNLNSAFESSTDEKDGILKKNSPSHRHNNTATSISASLHSTTMCSVTLGCLIWTLYIQITTNDSNYIAETFPVLIENHGWEILYLALIPTALSNFLQTYVQRFVSSERATIVYSMDPVYGAIASYILLGETLGSVWGYVGAALIFLASLTGVVFPPSSTSMSSDDREDDDSFIPFLSPSEDGSDEDAMAKTASACMDNKRPHNDELELYSDYRNWVEGWGTLVGIGLAIFSIAVNSYAAALIIFQESPSSGGANNASDSVQNTRFGFLIYACLLAALVSLWVALREMKLVLDGSEEGKIPFEIWMLSYVY